MAAKAAIPKPKPVRPVPTPMNAPDYEPPKPAAPKGPASWRLKVGRALPWLLTALVAALLFQIALAGFGIFDEHYFSDGQSDSIDVHRLFIVVPEILALLVLIVGFVGADKASGIIGIALLVLMELQYFFIEGPADGVRGLHVLNGVAVFGLALGLLLHRPPWAKA
jgi:hypothetical protein